MLLLIWSIFFIPDAPQSSSPAFTIPEADLIPEGIAYDPIARTIYVSSTYKRKIVSIDSLGTVRNFTEPGQDGLWGVLGMQVDADRRLLWAVSTHAGPGMPMQNMVQEDTGRSSVFKYDLNTGTLLKKYTIGPDPAHFLNDLVLNKAGDVFITDSRERSIFTISQQRDEIELLVVLENVGSPNGITISDDGRYLFTALWGGGDVGRISLPDRDLVLLKKPEGVKINADGLYFYHNNLITIEPFDSLEVVNRYQLTEDRTAIAHHEVLEAGHPALIQPTTGVIVGNRFYYNANSQLQVFSRLYNEHGEDFPKDQLHNVVILETILN